MDDDRFDGLTRALGALTDRRETARALAAGALGSLALLAGHDADAAKKKKKKKGGKKKKKKKASQCKAAQEKCGKACCNAGQTCIAGTCLGACQFDDSVANTMTLQADCATTETIDIPDGFTLEGDGKTIHMAGPVTGYQAVSAASFAVRAGVLIQNGVGSIRNVTIDQDPLEGCEPGRRHSAIVMAAGKGNIDAVTIALTQGNANCFRGITAAAQAVDDVINIRNTTVTGPRNTGISVSGAAPGSVVRGVVSDCTIRGAQFGLFLSETGRSVSPVTTFQVTGNTIEEAEIGITVGSFPANVLVDDNEITGEIDSTNLAGVNFSADTKGTVTNNNTISRFTCGIRISEDAAVTESNNTFSANTTNVCNLCETDGDCDDQSTSCQDGLCQAVCVSNPCGNCPICVPNLQSADSRPPLCANQLTQAAPDTCSTDADCTESENDVCIRPSSGPCTQSPCGICVSANICVP